MKTLLRRLKFLNKVVKRSRMYKLLHHHPYTSKPLRVLHRDKKINKLKTNLMTSRLDIKQNKCAQQIKDQQNNPLHDKTGKLSLNRE